MFEIDNLKNNCTNDLNIVSIVPNNVPIIKNIVSKELKVLSPKVSSPKTNIYNNVDTNGEITKQILKKNQDSEQEINAVKNELNDDYKELKKEFNNFLENILNGTTKIKNIIKKIDKQIQKNDLAKNKKNIKKKNINKDKGLAENKNVPKSIQLFFNLEEGIKMPRTKIGGLFQKYLTKNELKGNLNAKNKIDKRIYRFDDKLAQLFGINQEQMLKINTCSSSEIKYPNGYNFYNYQTWIKKLYEEKN